MLSQEEFERFDKLFEEELKPFFNENEQEIENVINSNPKIKKEIEEELREMDEINLAALAKAKASLKIEGKFLLKHEEDLILSRLRNEITEEEFIKHALEIIKDKNEER